MLPHSARPVFAHGLTGTRPIRVTAAGLAVPVLGVPVLAVPALAGLAAAGPAVTGRMASAAIMAPPRTVLTLPRVSPRA
jgi:hypothetical protein